MATRRTKNHELDAADRNAMPDSVFAFPRVRKEPLNDASHVRNAIARFDQVRDVSDTERDEAFQRIRKAARKFGVEMTETRWQQLGKPAKSSDKPRDTASKAELYAQAKKQNITGRSAMTKAELLSALRK
jgi:acyl-CoA reductase-like NAD-dependent aldehyde dehydrogenase